MAAQASPCGWRQRNGVPAGPDDGRRARGYGGAVVVMVRPRAAFWRHRTGEVWHLAV